MSSQSDSATVGAPILGLLGIVFVTLKLVGTIDWSWWWVLAPFWSPFALALAIFAIAGVIHLASRR